MPACARRGPGVVMSQRFGAGGAAKLCILVAALCCGGAQAVKVCLHVGGTSLALAFGVHFNVACATEST
jgi:hypothetical protein